MPTMTHTPTPWKVHPNTTDEVYICPADDEGNAGPFFTIASIKSFNLPEARRNAEFIVRAVNAHAAMREALKAVSKVAPGFHDISGVSYSEAEALFDQVQAALALTEAPHAD